MTYGFIEGIKNNQRLIGHSGTIRGFGTILDLLPEHELGYFFSFNLEYRPVAEQLADRAFRHRSPANFLVNLFCGLIAYSRRPMKLARGLAHHALLTA